MARAPLAAPPIVSPAASPGAELPEVPAEEEPDVSAQLEEETGLDLSDARDPEAEPLIDDEESVRVMQAPD